jgi:hypothetical protein
MHNPWWLVSTADTTTAMQSAIRPVLHSFSEGGNPQLPSNQSNLVKPNPQPFVPACTRLQTTTPVTLKSNQEIKPD